jgi:hypothetical protein
VIWRLVKYETNIFQKGKVLTLSVFLTFVVSGLTVAIYLSEPIALAQCAVQMENFPDLKDLKVETPTIMVDIIAQGSLILLRE